MNNKPATSASRKQGAVSGIRSLLFALSVTATLALWALFSKIERAPASAVETLPIATAAPAEVLDGEITLNLPPIPTLIPTVDVRAGAPAQGGGLPPTGLPAPVVPLVIKPVKVVSREGSPRPDRPPRASNRGGGGGTTRSSR
jgi:hypothetical protein